LEGGGGGITDVLTVDVLKIDVLELNHLGQPGLIKFLMSNTQHLILQKYLYVTDVTLHVTTAMFTNDLQQVVSEHCSHATSHLVYKKHKEDRR
jgi:hypothetical protein